MIDYVLLVTIINNYDTYILLSVLYHKRIFYFWVTQDTCRLNKFSFMEIPVENTLQKYMYTEDLCVCQEDPMIICKYYGRE